ncbi:ATP-binding cassette domain-containing protein [Micromonospora sp. WMMD1128]|uniref:ATP-binding cassette domain-containing protein n=1 Tax=unclassified Micromonospora TaxID=2617518 RepID=UPI00248D3560|nr:MULTISPECIES: ATP-binding cassette domain-containing protein [unclassified Micromonospora]WBB73863.1 ATP-binding cassette domain-containing protein [Micromonospora sp. WMMD1128]WFE32731.1 ATP-binding cassette domain-containing protein [Micromonospora sp. WMMD975]
MTQPGIEVEHLRKEFGDKVAVADISFTVAGGTLLGLLGSNGAGKTTIINCLTTLVRPDGGRAAVAGHDVVAQPAEVRASIALTGQFAALDEVLTGRENLVLFGRLLRLGRTRARQRAEELLDRFRLTEAADKPVKSYSGGMRRRLDLAASLVVERPVLFLDEPTTGLDPRSREEMWQLIRQLRDGGSTVLLTSQYLEEVDRLADRVVVLDDGQVIAEGTPDELKERVGGQVCEIEVPADRKEEAAAALRSGMDEVTERDGALVVPAPRARMLADVVRLLEEAGIEAENVALRKPTMDEVFFAFTSDGTQRPSAERSRA